MYTTSLFKKRNTQAVYIPAELAFANTDIDYEIERIGDELRIRPTPRSLNGIMLKFAAFSENFMAEGRGDHIQVERKINEHFIL